MDPHAGAINLTDPGSQALADYFDYGYSIPVGSSESITLNGLTPGTNYVATIFSYAWDDPYHGSSTALGDVQHGRRPVDRSAGPIRPR